MTSIFISYRAEDTKYPAGRLNDALANNFGQKSIFYDRKRLEGGNVWPDELERNIREAKIVLVLISDPKKWLGVEKSRGNRMDSKEDWVRKEIEIAFEYPDKIVIPILIDGKMPSKKDLPKSIKKITKIQAEIIYYNKWEVHFNSLVRLIESKLGLAAPKIVSPVEEAPKPDWESFFSQYQLYYGGPIITVNCDRIEAYYKGIYEHFKRHHMSQKNMVFFVNACTKQKPASLAQRLIFEIEDNGYTTAIPKKYGKNLYEGIKFEPIMKPEATYHKIWNLCNNFLSAETSDPIQLASSGICASKDYVSLIFTVTEKQWDKPDLCDQIEFFVSNFANKPVTSNKYILFFTFELDRPADNDIEVRSKKLEKIEALAQNLNLLEGIEVHNSRDLEPVPEEEVIKWFKDLIPGVRHEADAIMLQMLRRCLPDSCTDSNQFDMVYVEEMQHAAYQYLLKPNLPDSKINQNE